MRPARNTDPAKRYHRPRRPRELRLPTRGRTVLAAGIVAAVGATTLSAQGTYALWTDSASAQAGSFASGTFDITLDASLIGAGGTITRSDLSLSNLLPGESKAVTIVVKDQGSSPLRYDVLGTGSGALGSALQVSVTGAATASNSTSVSGFRTGSCSTGTPSYKTLGPTSAQVWPVTRSLASGASENACVIVQLDPAADSSLQGKTGSGLLAFSATQPTS